MLRMDLIGALLGPPTSEWYSVKVTPCLDALPKSKTQTSKVDTGKKALKRS